jgi:DNA primase
MNNLDIFQENIHLLDNVKLFTDENKLIFNLIFSKLKTGEKLKVDTLGIDIQLVDRISKFASIKHILNNHKNDQQKILELLDEYSHASEVHSLELRIEELESKFSKDLSETTFNEINDLKEEKKRKNIN